jgi:hypothetical protein
MWCCHWDLEPDRPPVVEFRKEAFDHRGLEAVDKSRPSTREVPNAQISTEGDTDRGEGIDARHGVARFDAPEMRPIDPGDCRELRERHTSVESQPSDVVPDMDPDPAHPTAGLELDGSGGDWHRSIETRGHKPRLTWGRV